MYQTCWIVEVPIRTTRDACVRSHQFLQQLVARQKGVQHQSSSYTDTRLTEITVDQLIGISEDSHSLTANTKFVLDICKKIYRYLDSFCQYDPRDLYLAYRRVIERLKGRAVVWTGQGFLAAECLAFGRRDDLEPYLTYVDGYNWNCHKFLSYLGVKEGYVVAAVAVVVMAIAAQDLVGQMKVIK